MAREVVLERTFGLRRELLAEMGLVANIQRFALHDGPGIRTTVYLKGCPLQCPWCHNPETLSARPQLMFTRTLCGLCRICERVCPQRAHELENGDHRVRFDRCAQCGQCVAACPAEALTMVGRDMSASDVMAVVRKDKDYYDRSGGGVTISGGEPLFQPEFALALLRACATEGIHAALDTSGHAPAEVFDPFIEAVGLFLFDLKTDGSERHERLTGAGNSWILRNLNEAASRGADVLVRVPLIPGINSDEEELRAMARLVAGLAARPPVQFLPHHDYGRRKYEALGLAYRMPNGTRRPSNECLEAAKAIFTQHGISVVEEV